MPTLAGALMFLNVKRRVPMAGYKRCLARVSAESCKLQTSAPNAPGAGTVRVADCHVACSGLTMP
jgi:hypothetical protein